METATRTDPMGFAKFQMSDPARSMFRKLGLEHLLEEASSWRSLRALVIAFNRCDGVCSSGERVLLHAIAAACDFAWLADELTDGQAWRRMGRASGSYLWAVAACILAADQV